jgi:hypothetical protein
MEIGVEIKDSYIYVKISGPISLDASGWKKIESVRIDVEHTIKKTGINRLLFDCQDLSGKISTLDRFLVALFFVKENMKFISIQGPLLKIAFVVNKSMIDAERFGEKVAHNRGLHGLVTDNIQEALNWLDLAAPSKHKP